MGAKVAWMVSQSYHEAAGAAAAATPPRPLTFEVYAELRDTFARLQREEQVRAVVITGKGRGFCSGGDVEEIIGQLLSRGSKGMTEFARMTGELTRNILELR